MSEGRVLGYKLSTEITYEEMNEVAGGSNSAHHTMATTTEYTYPIGMDILIDHDFATNT